MTEEQKNQKIEEKKVEKPVEKKKEEDKEIEAKPIPNIESPEVKNKETKDKKEDKSSEASKVDEKKETPKPKQKIIKKEEAVARSTNLHVSMKQCKYICKFIKNKKIDQAISDLEQVMKYKIAVPFKGEIPHRKGKGIMSGRYPIKASTYIIATLKALKGNIIANGIDLEKAIIVEASANWGARPLRKGNVQGKRTNVMLKAKEVLINK
jgi:large subunit ribosomal protein L22